MGRPCRGQVSIEVILITVAVLVAASIGAYIYLSYVSREATRLSLQSLRTLAATQYSCRFVELGETVGVKLILNRVPVPQQFTAFVLSLEVLAVNGTPILRSTDLDLGTEVKVVGAERVLVITKSFTVHLLTDTTRRETVRVLIVTPEHGTGTVILLLNKTTLLGTGPGPYYLVVHFWLIRGQDLYEISTYRYLLSRS